MTTTPAKQEVVDAIAKQSALVEYDILQFDYGPYQWLKDTAAYDAMHKMMVEPLRKALALSALPLEAMKSDGTNKLHTPEMQHSIDDSIKAIRSCLGKV